MVLSEYLRNNNVTYTAFAKRVGVSRVTVMKWATGRIMPRPEHISSIFEATRGSVTLKDVYVNYDHPNTKYIK